MRGSVMSSPTTPTTFSANSHPNMTRQRNPTQISRPPNTHPPRLLRQRDLLRAILLQPQSRTFKRHPIQLQHQIQMLSPHALPAFLNLHPYRIRRTLIPKTNNQNPNNSSNKNQRQSEHTKGNITAILNHDVLAELVEAGNCAGAPAM